MNKVSFNLTAGEIVHKSWEAGKDKDLSNIGYGRIHWGNFKDIKETPAPYYYFLSGLVDDLGIKNICEIGTHSGGATRAMLEGMKHQEGGKIVTIDITKESNKYLSGIENIEKIQGDANARACVESVLRRFVPNQNIDLLFIDAAHMFIPTMLNYGIYVTLLKPYIVVIDDININEEMREVWSYITCNMAEADFIDVSKALPELERDGAGFGLIILRENFNLAFPSGVQIKHNPRKAKIRYALKQIGIR